MSLGRFQLFSGAFCDVSRPARTRRQASLLRPRPGDERRGVEVFPAESGARQVGLGLPVRGLPSMVRGPEVQFGSSVFSALYSFIFGILLPARASL